MLGYQRLGERSVCTGDSDGDGDGGRDSGLEVDVRVHQCG